MNSNDVRACKEIINERLNPSAIIRILDADCLGMRNKKDEISSFSIDSRNCGEGSFFVPLPGRFTDGHLFLEDAMKNGCMGAFVSEAFVRNKRGSIRSLCERFDTVFVIVPEVLKALQDIAEFHRERLTGLYRIAVTGSNGKTTTKEIIGSILKVNAETFVSRGNFNSEIGLPLSILEMTGKQRYAVCELGINNPGEMGILSEIYKPDAAVITNIGNAHIGRLGSKENIAFEKSKIFSHFSGTETAFIAEHEEFKDLLSRKVKGAVVYYGENTTPGFRGFEDRGFDGNIIYWEDLRINLPLPGYFNLRNALAAISVAVKLGIEKDAVKQGIENVRPLFGRGEVFRGTVTVIQDCYNANPDSMKESLQYFLGLSWEGRRVLVLGAMKELGDFSYDFHDQLIADVYGMEAAAAFLVGEEMIEAVERRPPDRHLPMSLITAKNVEGILEKLTAFLRDGDLVLIKGSRSLELEKITKEITNKKDSGG